jgi:antitoxin PrlF
MAENLNSLRQIDSNEILPYHIKCRTFKKVPPMTKLTVTARGQVTFRKDVLQHLGIKPGEQIEFDKLPGGELQIRVARPKGSIKGFIGLLAGSTDKILSVEEMNEIAAAGWAGGK